VVGKPYIGSALGYTPYSPPLFQQGLWPKPRFPEDPPGPERACRPHPMPPFYKKVIETTGDCKVTGWEGVPQGFERRIKKDAHRVQD